MIEKDWIATGHNFVDFSTDDTSYGKTQKKRHLSKKCPVALVLFLDCVKQLQHQFPTAFEFDDSLLVLILDEFYFSRFGLTFFISTSFLICS